METKNFIDTLNPEQFPLFEDMLPNGSKAGLEGAIAIQLSDGRLRWVRGEIVKYCQTVDAKYAEYKFYQNLLSRLATERGKERSELCYELARKTDKARQDYEVTRDAVTLYLGLEAAAHD